jgi:hypothetical protein
MLRVGSATDIELILKYAKEAHTLGIYQRFTFDDDKARQTISDCLRDGVAILSTSGVIGGLVVQPHYCKERIATELLWVSLATNPKQRIVEAELLQSAFEYWAKEVAHADAVAIGALGSPDRYFEKRSYTKTESGYLKCF